MFGRRQVYRPVIADSLDDNNITAGGHLFQKTFQEGDDKLLLEPHQHYNGLFLFKKYRRNHDGTALLTQCDCHYWGLMCKDCIVLNTTFFYNLQVPLNPQDFEKLETFFLQEQKWTHANLYNWLCFWIREVSHRWTTFAGETELVFFRYEKFIRKNPHKFFYYLFDFVVNKRLVLKEDPDKYKPLFINLNGGVIRDCNTNQKTMPDCLVIKTGDAMIRLSCKIYGNGGRVSSISTKIKNSFSVICFTYQNDPFRDQFSFYQKIMLIRDKERWKHVFRNVVDEINREVRFRPRMCGMEDCMSSFYKYAMNQS